MLEWLFSLLCKAETMKDEEIIEPDLDLEESDEVIGEMNREAKVWYTLLCACDEELEELETKIEIDPSDDNLKQLYLEEDEKAEIICQILRWSVFNHNNLWQREDLDLYDIDFVKGFKVIKCNNHENFCCLGDEEQEQSFIPESICPN